MKETDLLTKAECIKCKFLSNEFYQLLRIDYPFNEKIKKYNQKHHVDLSFEEYILKNSDCLWEFLMSRTNYFKEPSADQVYTFIVHVRADITTEEIKKEFDKDNSAMLNDRWINSDKWEEQEGDLTVEQFMANVRKAKALKAAKKRKKGQKIEKYDKDWKLVCTYNDRQECIEAEGITKGALSQVLTGKRKSVNGYYFIET